MLTNLNINPTEVRINPTEVHLNPNYHKMQEVTFPTYLEMQEITLMQTNPHINFEMTDFMTPLEYLEAIGPSLSDFTYT